MRNGKSKYWVLEQQQGMNTCQEYSTRREENGERREVKNSASEVREETESIPSLEEESKEKKQGHFFFFVKRAMFKVWGGGNRKL